jgi:pimeloyl-ACP methyl ester carboxylesterase
MLASPRSSRWSAVSIVIAAVLFVSPAASAAKRQSGDGPLDWKPCGATAEIRTECATQVAPLDYDRPEGRTIRIALARVPATDQAHRIGSLFFNFGGPGGPQVDYLQVTGGAGLFDALNERFDIVGFDPRGVGQSEPAIDCKVNQETQGVYSQPFPTPLTLDLRALLAKDRAYFRRCLQLNDDILAHASTADVARDMDVMRESVGDRRLTYLGFSYGTFLGATYASLFPDSFRALVLDGPVDVDEYLSDPLKGTNEQTAAFERAFGRFMQACAADQTNCRAFGGSDPWDAYDRLVDRADASPIPAAGYAPDPRPVDGDDINAATLAVLYAKQLWPALAQALAAAEAGDGSVVRLLVDEFFYGRDPDTGTYDPFSDRFVAIYAAESVWPTDVGVYVREGDQAWGMFDHFWINHGYAELTFGFWPVKAQDVYRGPFRVRESAPTPLVVATTYDPATPYRGALRTLRTLGNARLLTMRGDGHTAYGGNSPCIDSAVNAYLIEGTLPAAGTTCRQEVPFAQPTDSAAVGTGSRKAMPKILGPTVRRRAVVR